MIDDIVINDILGKINIIEVIGERIPLKRAGRNFKALCPFHKEKTPSFLVSQDKQIYHCFGCSAGGNAINFLIEYDRLEFPEAVETLARRVGVTIPQKHKDARAESGLSTRIYRINEIAAQFYSGLLFSPSGAKARAYLSSRGVTAETAKVFRLGLSSDGWDGLIRHLREMGVGLADAEKAGLVTAREGGGFYDRFRGRLMFPITGVKGDVLGFGARVFDASLPKYINSPETPVYTKGKVLYGFEQAKDAVRETDSIVIVEGNLDCIIPWQTGCKNIAASMGTALTPDQVRMLKRYTEHAVIVYDGDAAGQAASLRSLDVFIDESVDVRVVALPEGLDPDSFVRQKGIDAFKKLIVEAEDIIDYKLRVLTARHGTSQPQAKARIASELLATVKKFKNRVLVSEYVRRIADRIGCREEDLFAELTAIKNTGQDEHAFSRPETVDNRQPLNPTERLIIRLMLEETSLIERMRERVSPADFLDARTSRIVSLMFELASSGQKPTAGALLNQAGSDISPLLTESALEPSCEIPENDREKILEECISRLINNRSIRERKLLQEEIRKAERGGDQDRLTLLTREFNSLLKRGSDDDGKKG